MATAIAMEPAAEAAREVKGARARSAGTGRKRSSNRVDANGTTRFFLGKSDGKTPALEREVTNEKEALLESLKTGQSYFAVCEWRAKADLSKDVPQIRKEAVKREERDHRSPPAQSNVRGGGPAQAS